jgi:hypothetical protein
MSSLAEIEKGRNEVYFVRRPIGIRLPAAIEMQIGRPPDFSE